MHPSPGQKHDLAKTTCGALTALLLLLSASAAAIGIGARQPFTGDEAIVLSVSETLATRGQLGAPIFEGVAGAERAYFASLPLLHIAHWPVFRLFGAGATQARAVSLVAVFAAALALLLYAVRAHGGACALLLAVLLLFWRSDLLGLGWGLPLQALARSGRYDALQLSLLAFVLLANLRWLARPTPRAEILLGLLAGAAVLTHFLGLVAPLAILLTWAIAGHERPALRSLARVVLVVAVVVLPYALFVAVNWSDAQAQFAAVHGGRAAAAASGPSAVVANVLAEWQRYGHLLRARTPGPWLAVVSVPVLIAWVAWNWSGERARLARVVCGHLAAPLLLLLALEPTKAPLYALPLVVPACLVLALAAGDVMRRMPAYVRLAIIALFVLLAAEGGAALVREAQAAALRPSYMQAAGPIAEHTAGGAAVGAIRWWWAMRHQSSYTPLVTLVYRARTDSGASDDAFRRAWQAADVRYLVHTPELEADAQRAGQAVHTLVEAVRTRCGRSILRIDDVTYGPVEVFELRRPCTAFQ